MFIYNADWRKLNKIRSLSSQRVIAELTYKVINSQINLPEIFKLFGPIDLVLEKSTINYAYGSLNRISKLVNHH